MVNITKERVAQICNELYPNNEYSDKDHNDLILFYKKGDFESEEDFIYCLKNLPKVMGAKTLW